MCNPTSVSPPKPASISSSPSHYRSRSMPALPISPASMPLASPSSNPGSSHENNDAPTIVLKQHRDDDDGEESRNDDRPAAAPLHWRRPLGGTYTRRSEGEEDEIPSLIDEDHPQHDDSSEEPTLSRESYQPWQQQEEEQESFPQHPPPREQQQQPPRILQRHSSTPPPAQRQQVLPSAKKDDNNSRLVTCNSKEAALPFFVLDWMLDDLVPEDQNAQDLAKILNQQQAKEMAAPVPMRKSKSCDMVVGSGIAGSTTTSNSSSAPSFFSWQQVQQQQQQPTMPVAPAVPQAPTNSKHIFVSDPPASPPSSPSTIDLPPMPKTPKSSNRKASRMRQKQLKDPEGHHWDDEQESTLFLPRNLHQSLDEASGDATTTTGLPQPRLSLAMPSTIDNAHPERQPPQREQPQMGSSFGTKSLSCPDFLQDEDDDDTTSATSTAPLSPNGSHSPPGWKTMQMRKRAKEQNDRRERRNKLTIVQRSLTLAQGWNNKGLIMAGKATRAELQVQHQQPPRESNAAENQQSQFLQAPIQEPGPDHWWESSLECWNNALEIYRSLLGEYHERVADVQNNRGIALGKLRRFEEALGALDLALRARRKQKERFDLENERRDESVVPGSNNANNNNTMAVVTAAIVSTLHNIANVFREAGNPTEALKVLIEAQMALRESERDLLRKGSSHAGHHRHHCKHQSARLSTAIGHIYYESEQWRDARDHYGDALEVYDRLLVGLAKQSDKLGWGSRQSPEGGDDARLRLELLQHKQLLEREVQSLERDLDELDRCQQARGGSRARLLQARRQQQQRQQQQNHHKRVPKHPQQHNPNETPTLMGIVSSLRA